MGIDVIARCLIENRQLEEAPGEWLNVAHEPAIRRAIYGAGVSGFKIPFSRSGLVASRSSRGYFSPS